MGLRVFYQRISSVAKRYIKENWGFPFIAGFLLFLSTAAVLSAVGLIAAAEIIADIAYFAITIGVLLELLCLTKNSKERKRDFNGAS